MPPLFTKGPFSSAEHKHPRDCFGSLFLFVPPAVIVYVNPSVNPPFGVLPAPRSGSLLVLPPTKSCPRLWGKWHEVPKGVRLKTAECRELFPPSASLTLSSSPVSRWRLLVQYKLGVQCRTPSRSDRFNGVTGGAGGPKGRNRNLPWPPCKKGYKETPFSFVYLNPSVTAYAVPAPRPGSLLVQYTILILSLP